MRPFLSKMFSRFQVVAILRFLLAQDKDERVNRELSRLETHLEKRCGHIG